MVAVRSRLLFIVFVIFPVWGEAQGLVMIDSYGPDEYNVSPQNWAVSINHKGTIMFGNSAGLLQFDSHEWSFEHVPSGGLARSFGILNGDIFWGGNGDFGVVQTDSLNRFYPVSFLNRVDSSSNSFSSVWQFVEHDSLMFARTYEGLYIFDGDTVFAHPTNSSLRSVFPFRDR